MLDKRKTLGSISYIFLNTFFFILVALSRFAFVFFLPPEEFGIYTFSIIFQNSLSATLGLSFGITAFNFFHRMDTKNERKRFYSSLINLFLILQIGFLIFFEFIGPILLFFLTGIDLYTSHIRIVMLIIPLLFLGYTLPRQLLIAQQKILYLTFLEFMLMATTIVFPFSLLLLVGRNAQIALIGELIGYIVLFSIISLPYLRLWRPFLLLSTIKDIFFYGSPLILHFLAHWLMSNTPAYFVVYYYGLTMEGIWNMAQNVGNAFWLIIGSVNNLILPQFILKGREVKEIAIKNKALEIPRFFSQFMLLVIVFGILLLLADQTVFPWVFPTGYLPSLMMISPIIIAVMIKGTYLMIANTIAHTLRKTSLLSLTTTSVAVIQIITTALLCYCFGLDGLLLGTILTSVILGFISYIAMITQIRILPERRILKLLLSGLIVLILLQIFNPTNMLHFNLFVIVIYFVLTLGLFFSLLTIFGFWDKQEREYAKRIYYFGKSKLISRS